MLKRYIGDLFITRLWFLLMVGLVILFFISFFVTVLLIPAVVLLVCATVYTLADYSLLFFSKGSVNANRIIPVRLSLGDENSVTLSLINRYSFKVRIALIDELPEQFQERSFLKKVVITPLGRSSVSYTLRPLTRGEYNFGHLIGYARSPFGVLQRRFMAAPPVTVKVYPSFLQLKKYQLLAVNENVLTGVKKVRRVGHSLEFEKIKDYVPGDDIRTINWKATARSSALMVNTYTDARQQQVYCIIDKGRAMKMPFEGMTLLDYSIDASLALLNMVLLKQDKAGLITFSNRVNEVIPAERRSTQLNRLLEALYKQQTEFKESDYEALWFAMHKRISQRSLLLLFTNFETYSSLERQLPSLKRMASRHLVCVVFFQNTLLKQIKDTKPDDLEGIYIKTIAEQFDYEKRQIVKLLRQQGIISILTTPAQLSADVINKYLELKARQMV